MSQEFSWKIIDETRKYFIDEINQNELMSKKYKNVFRALNVIEHLLISASAVTGCVPISAFASLVLLCFFWYSHSHCKSCSRVKNLCNNCINYEV